VNRSWLKISEQETRQLFEKVGESLLALQQANPENAPDSSTLSANASPIDRILACLLPTELTNRMQDYILKKVRQSKASSVEQETSVQVLTSLSAVTQDLERLRSRRI